SAAAARQELRTQRDALASLVDAWRKELDALRLQEQAAQNSGPLAPAGAEFTVLSELQTQFDGARQVLEERRAVLAEALRTRDELRRAPPPSVATVDPGEREGAYAADRVLQEDLRHLRVQLLQVRTG